MVFSWTALAGPDADHLVGRRRCVHELLARGVGQAVERGLHGPRLLPVEVREVLFLLHEEVELPLEHAVVDGGLDVEDLDVLLDDTPLPDHGRVQRARLLARVHVAVAVAHHVGVVIRAQRLVARQARGHRLVATVHGNQVEVNVDEQVALGGALVDLDQLVLVGAAKVHHAVGVFGVMVVEAVGPEGVEDLVAHRVLDLVRRHATVDGQGRDEVDVVHAVVAEDLEHDLEHALADVGPLHGRQR